MKLKLLIAFLFSTPFVTFAQVGIGTNNPDNSAALHINSAANNRGLLIPRMTLAQRNAIVSPANGLFIYQLDGQVGVYFYDAPTTSWKSIASGGWSLVGNANINPLVDYLGTNDAQPLVFKTDNVERMRILPSTPTATSGFVGIGTPSPTAKLHIVGPTGALNVNDGFEDNTIPPFTVGTVIGAAANWGTTNAVGEFSVGTRGARSNNQANNTTNFMQYVTAVIPAQGATVSFDFRVSSESCCDGLRLLIDGVPVAGADWRGEIPFTTVTYNLAGGAARTIRWEYFKDVSVNTGLDRAFVDNISVVSNPATLRIDDGGQANGQVLMSDATGAGTWSPAGAFPATVWLTSGNGSTTPGTNFLGTTDNLPLNFFTNNTQKMTVLANGNVGIGIAAPTSKLHVFGTDNANPMIYARNTNSTGGTLSRGLFGEARATVVGSAGLTGVSLNRGANEIGVMGDYSDTGTSWGVAVLGTGIGGSVNDINFLPVTYDFGVFGTVNSAVGTGVYGKNNNASGFGVYAEGNFAVTGIKPASIPTSKGNQLVYCIENPEIWFEDLGTGKLTNGSTHVKLDTMFLESVFIDENHKASIFLQEQGDSEGLTYTMDADNRGFTVKEKEAGRSNIDFSYRIFAKRRFYQDHRFGVDSGQPFENNLIKHKDVPVATTDPKKMKRFVESYRKKELKNKK
jgi:hypothetical protein